MKNDAETRTIHSSESEHHKEFNRLDWRLVLFIALLLSGPLAAEPLAPVCSNSSMASYLTPGFTCQIGDVLFENFQFQTLGGNSQPIAAGVRVTPIETDPIGLNFGDWSVRTGQTNQVWIRYSATTAPGSMVAIDRVLAGVSVWGILGSVEVEKHLCAGWGFAGTPTGSGALGGLSCGSPTGSYQSGAFTPFFTANRSGEVDLSPNLTTVGVLDYVRITGGFLGGTSLMTLSTQFVQVSAVPEPSSAVLTLFGVGALVAWRWRGRLKLNSL